MNVKITVAGVTYEGEVVESAISELVTAGVRAIILNTVPRSDETRESARQRAFQEAITGERFGAGTDGNKLKEVLESLGVPYEAALQKIMDTGVSEATAKRTLRNHPKVVAVWPVPTKTGGVKIEGLDSDE